MKNSKKVVGEGREFERIRRITGLPIEITRAVPGKNALALAILRCGLGPCGGIVSRPGGLVLRREPFRYLRRDFPVTAIQILAGTSLVCKPPMRYPSRGRK